MGYSINLGAWSSVFAVPAVLVDKHLKLAGAAQLKVLLWVLRHAGVAFGDEDIGTALNMHPADVRDAMQYWTETGILSLSGELLAPGEAPESPAPAPVETLQEAPAAPAPVLPPPEAKESPKAEIRAARPLSRPQKPDSVTIAKRMEESADVAFLMQEAQVILGKTISNGDCATLLMLHDTDGLPVDVIIMLMQYTVGIGKGNMRYIEKCGIGWADEGIDSLDKAELKIRRLGEREKAWSVVVRTLGLERRSPTAKEAGFADRWINEFKFSADMVREAYERNVDAKGKFSFPYMNSILERWSRQGIRSPEEAKSEQRPQKVRGESGGRSPSYDIDAYERESIFDE